MESTEARKRVDSFVEDILNAVSKYGFDITLSDGAVIFVDRESQSLVGVWLSPAKWMEVHRCV